MHVEIMWLERVSSRTGELTAFAVPEFGATHTVTGSRVPQGARPASASTPRDPNCARILEARPGGFVGPKRRPKRPTWPGPAQPEPEAPKPRGRPAKGTFTEASTSYCRGCRARTRWEPAEAGRYLMCVGCEERFPCSRCTHLDCAEVSASR